MRTVPIKNFLDKFPGGIIIIPLLIGCLLNTFCPAVLQIGSFTTGLATGTSSLMGALFICLGAQLNVKCAPQALKTGFTLLIAKLLAGVLIGLLAAKLFNDSLLGLSMLAIVAAVSNSNGAMYATLTGQYGTASDQGATAIISFNDGPFLTLVAVGASGMADIPLQSLICAIAPILAGLILGNLDKDIADFLKPGLNVLIPFFAFCLGAGISLANLVKGGLSGILLGVICVAWSGLICILADKFILKRPGYAGAAVATAAGNCVATPAAVAVAAPAFEPYVESATAQCAAAVIVTVILVPLLTSWAAKKWGTAAEWAAKKAAEKA